MKYRNLGKTNLKVSEIGFGGIPIQRVSFSVAKSIIHQLFEKGINFWDTARAYSDSEEKIGEALSDLPREQIILATKSRAREITKLKEEIDLSLKKLQTEYIDLYQLHNVSNFKELDSVFSNNTIEALKKAQQEGKIRYIGISSHNSEIAIEALNRENFDTVQFPFNPLEVEAAAELLPLAQKMGVGTIIMKPLCGGALENKELALRYLLDYQISTIIPGIQSEEELTQNLKAANRAPLTEEEKFKLDEEVKELGNQFCRRCEYCRPCPAGISITFCLLMLGYYKRYGLHEWAYERYHSQDTKASACQDCGECEDKCPYNLPVREMLNECREIFE